MPKLSPGGLSNWTGFRNRDDQLAIVLSVIIGVVVGLTVVAFLLLTGRLADRMYPPESPVWRRMVVPVAGTLVSGFLLVRYFPNARGSGIPQAKFALFLQDGYISLRTVLGKFLCCSITLASGIALGREGPSVQIGAGIASVISRRFGLSKSTVKALVPVGCTAALAAAFNTPIAAVLFSLEEILGDLNAPVLASVVLSSAMSWMTLHLIMGDEPLFHVPPYQLVHPMEFGIYAILGIVGGLASVIFVKLLLRLRIWFRSLPPKTMWLQPTAGGLLMAVVGIFVPQALGAGYDYVDRVLTGTTPFRMVLLLAILKLISTPVCYSSGNAGGIFGPSLFIGAMIGGLVGTEAHQLLPGFTATPGAYALVGMGTAFAGIVRTPLTSVIMIFEITRDYSIIVPLMISNLISFFISQKLQPEPVYEALALQDGIYLPSGHSKEGLSTVHVSEVMQRDAEPVALDTDVAAFRSVLAKEECTAWPVGERKNLRGVVSIGQLETAQPHPHTVGELVKGSGFPYVHSDHALSYVLERMSRSGMDVLPVVSRSNLREMVGLVTLGDVLATYGFKDGLSGKVV
jgi:chloride channel protein, CIC family